MREKLTRRGALGFVALVPLGTARISHVRAEAVDPIRDRSKIQTEHYPPSFGEGIRISTEQGDVGERLYAELMSQEKKITVFLDDIEQPMCVTADEDRGYIVRIAQTKNGEVAVNWTNSNILMETKFGHVRVVIA